MLVLMLTGDGYRRPGKPAMQSVLPVLSATCLSFFRCSPRSACRSIGVGGNSEGDAGPLGRRVHQPPTANAKLPPIATMPLTSTFLPPARLVAPALLALSALLACRGVDASTHPCAAHAIKQAKALLVFHSGAESDASVDDGVQVQPPLRNPVNRRQLFDVLRLQGHVYRADYQLTMIYARVPGQCVLMGQEVLERSSP